MTNNINKSLDYNKKMEDLDFHYDEEFYPNDEELPDPQKDPLIFGARVPLQKVGVSGVDLPIKFKRRDGSIQELHVKASLYGSLDDPELKGLNLSRFPILMHEMINPAMIKKDATLVGQHFSIEVMQEILRAFAEKQGSKTSFCKFKFAYPWTQNALRTRKELPSTASGEEVFKVVEGKKLSHEKAEGYIFYNCELEGQYHNHEYKFFLTVDYTYSSTCPCSFELAHDARTRRGKAANAHSQRSIAKIKVQFDPSNIVWIEDVVEMARKYVPTEVAVIVKRRDEQAFAERNGSFLLFSEDAARLFYQGLDEMINAGKISDFSIVIDHWESLHGWNATVVVWKNIPGGLR